MTSTAMERAERIYRLTFGMKEPVGSGNICWPDRLDAIAREIAAAVDEALEGAAATAHDFLSGVEAAEAIRSLKSHPPTPRPDDDALAFLHGAEKRVAALEHDVTALVRRADANANKRDDLQRRIEAIESRLSKIGEALQ